jgi:hypothetical protein
MAKMALGLKRVIGRVLLKLHERPRTFVAEEKDAAELLVTEGLVQFNAFALPAELVPPEDSHATIKKSATFHYTLTPEGVTFVRRHEVDELADGKFWLPSEVGWLGTATGKWVSRIVKLIVGAGIAFYLGMWFLGCKNDAIKPTAPTNRRGRSVMSRNPWRV